MGMSAMSSCTLSMRKTFDSSLYNGITFSYWGDSISIQYQIFYSPCKLYLGNPILLVKQQELEVCPYLTSIILCT